MPTVHATLRILFAALSMVTSSACAQPKPWSPQWRDTGIVVDGKHTIRTPLTLVHAGLLHGNRVLLGGYKTSSDGKLEPYIVAVSRDGVTTRQWALSVRTTAFFLHANRVHGLLYDGQVVELVHEQWRPSALKGEVDAHLVSAEALLACSPRPRAMADQRRGACYTLDGRWRQEVSWQEFEPVLCGPTLYIIEERFVASLRKRRFFETTIDSQSGQLHREQLPRKPRALRCPK